ILLVAPKPGNLLSKRAVNAHEILAKFLGRPIGLPLHHDHEFQHENLPWIASDSKKNARGGGRTHTTRERQGILSSPGLFVKCAIAYRYAPSKRDAVFSSCSSWLGFALFGFVWCEFGASLAPPGAVPQFVGPRQRGRRHSQCCTVQKPIRSHVPRSSSRRTAKSRSAPCSAPPTGASRGRWCPHNATRYSNQDIVARFPWP